MTKGMEIRGRKIFKNLLNDINDQIRILEDWNMQIILPIYKKRDKRISSVLPVRTSSQVRLTEQN